MSRVRHARSRTHEAQQVQKRTDYRRRRRRSALSPYTKQVSLGVKFGTDLATLRVLNIADFGKPCLDNLIDNPRRQFRFIYRCFARYWFQQDFITGKKLKPFALHDIVCTAG